MFSIYLPMTPWFRFFSLCCTHCCLTNIPGTDSKTPTLSLKSGPCHFQNFRIRLGKKKQIHKRSSRESLPQLRLSLINLSAEPLVPSHKVTTLSTFPPREPQNLPLSSDWSQNVDVLDTPASPSVHQAHRH